MNYFKKMVSAALILSMLAALVPAAVFAAGGRWTVSYDAEAYEEGTLSVTLFDARADATVAVEWDDLGGTLRAGATTDELFDRGAEYYAVVSYTPRQSGGSGSDGSGGSSDLTDAQIEAEFDLYYVAQYGKAVPTLGIPDDDATAEELFTWYGDLLEEDAFWVWNDDEEEGAWLDKFSVEELRAQADDRYDPDYDDYDEIVADTVGDYVDAYMDYSSPYFNYDLSAKRGMIEMMIQFPDYAPPGYTPPSVSGGSGGGGTPSDGDPAYRTVLRRLTEADMASGFAVGADFFDGCVPLEVTPVPIGQTYDPVTYGPVDGFSEVRAYFIADGHTIPALPENDEGADGEEYEYGNGPGVSDAGVGFPSDHCGAVPDGVPFYVSQGEMLVTTSADASSEIVTGVGVEPFADWEKVTVGRSGASVDFTSGRRFVTVSACEDGLDDADTVSLTAYITGGDLGSAVVSSQLVTYDFDTESHTVS
ncbi:MAG: hypothetical protein IKN36_06165, partial [Clostridia bacterium]|nr:hypothetical protein [Clostridia bacterium]